VKEGQRVILLSRNLNDATAQYSSVARMVAQLPADRALLDGEIVAVDENGLPSFQALHHQSAHTIVYYTTRDGLLRHSEFVALRDDKRPSDVRREPTG
jgi:bifunctional non-homologous end joining protein LigD